MRDNERMIGGHMVMVQSCRAEGNDLRANIGVTQNDNGVMYVEMSIVNGTAIASTNSRRENKSQMSSFDLCLFANANAAEIETLIRSLL